MRASKGIRSSFIIGPAIAALTASSLVVGGVGSFDTVAPPPSRPDMARIDADLDQLPLSFEANHGQSDPQVKLLARNGGRTVFLTPDEAVFALRTAAEDGSAAHRSVLRMKMLGGNSNAAVTGAAQLAGKVNYLSSDAAKAHSNVPTYARAESKGVYPGIDMAWYGIGADLEYDFIVSPGADPSAIRLGFEGARDLRIDSSGDLVMRVGNQEVRQHKPVLYQEVGGQRIAVPGRFVPGEDDRIGFGIGSYDTSRPLVIDPVIVWSSYLGGSGRDTGTQIEVDAGGNVWVAGPTESADFPTRNAPDTTLGEWGQSYFVTKIAQASGVPQVAYSTYIDNGLYSGSDNPQGIELALDDAGDAYIAGQVYGPGIPTTPGAYQPESLQAEFTNFVAKLAADGSAFAYSTYFSHASGEFRTYALDVNAAGEINVGGTASFPDHTAAPAGTTGAFQEACVPNTGQVFCGDAFLAKLQPAGNGSSDLTYFTYLGGGGNDDLLDVEVDSEGVAYMSGQTRGSFPTTPGAFDTSPGAGLGGQTTDGWAAKLNPAGGGSSDLLYSTYLAGDVTDRAYGAAAGPDGSLYVAGVTHDYRSVGAEVGMNLVTTPGSLQPSFFPDENFAGSAFMVRINPASTGASDLVYSTLMGGVRGDAAFGLEVDANGWAYVAGYTESDTFPRKNAIQKVCYCFYDLVPDAFVSVINPDPDDPNGGTGDRGDLLFGTFLGGTGFDSAYDIALGPGGKIHVTGATEGPAGPPPGVATARHFPRLAAFQKQYAGGVDGFVTKISKVSAP